MTTDAPAFRQLNRNLSDGTRADHDNKVAHADVGITHAAHGKLCRIVADGVLPEAPCGILRSL